MDTVIDPKLLDRNFTVVQSSDAGAGIVRAFENSPAMYCVIGDRWTPGDYALLLSRPRFIGDLVDLAFSERQWREHWHLLLMRSPKLLSTFIAGGLLKELKELPQFKLDTAASFDLSAQVKRNVNEYLADYLQSWPRRSDLPWRIDH